MISPLAYNYLVLILKLILNIVVVYMSIFSFYLLKIMKRQGMELMTIHKLFIQIFIFHFPTSK
jgi:hypothetical protein